MKVHFRNLNSIRFIAAGIVIYSHVNQLLRFSDSNITNTGIEDNLGKLGVNLFYALSGFLITSLLVKEKEGYKKIAIRKFYIRRVLRIWPLYFLLVGLSLFILPHIPLLRIDQWNDNLQHFWPSLLLFTLILPNVQMLLYGPIPYANQLWSIGVEEQFYLFWPLVVNKVSGVKNLKKVVVAIIIIYVLLKIVLIKTVQLDSGPVLIESMHFMKNYFQIDCLLIGSLFGLINLNETYRRILTKKYVQVITYAVLAVLLISHKTFASFYWEIYAVVFGMIILNLVNDSSIINMEYKLLSYLGKISYGMYMYHFLIINIIIRLVTHDMIPALILSLMSTCIVSAISYEFLEKRFFEMKKKYTVINSG